MSSDKIKQRLDDATYAAKCAYEVHRSIIKQRKAVFERWNESKLSTAYLERYNQLCAEAYVASISANAVLEVALNDYRKDSAAIDGSDKVAS